MKDKMNINDRQSVQWKLDHKKSPYWLGVCRQFVEVPEGGVLIAIKFIKESLPPLPPPPPPPGTEEEDKHTVP